MNLKKKRQEGKREEGASPGELLLRSCSRMGTKQVRKAIDGTEIRSSKESPFI